MTTASLLTGLRGAYRDLGLQGRLGFPALEEDPEKRRHGGLHWCAWGSLGWNHHGGPQLPRSLVDSPQAKAQFGRSDVCPLQTVQVPTS